MCLTFDTARKITSYKKCPFSEEDKLFVIDAYETIWNNLDHSRHYCINPMSLFAEILKRSGKTSYCVWMPKNKIKAGNYENIIGIMMNTLNKKILN